MRHDLVVAGKVVTRSGLSEAEIGISEGRIAEVRKQGLAGERTIRAGRAVIFPGFIDIHVHMREPGWERKEDFRTGSEAALHGGVTAVADMPNNPRPIIDSAAAKEKSAMAKRKSLVDVKIYGGVVAENLRRIGAMSPLVVGYKAYLAKSTGGLVLPDGMLAEALRLAAEAARPLSMHCEDQAVIDASSGGRSGSDERPPSAEVASVNKAVSALRKVPQATGNVCHASTGETVALVQSARAGGLHLECEAALHHLYFNRSAAQKNRLLKTNPPLRAESDRMALLEGLKEGKVSFLVTDHAPHLLEEKETEGASGVPGLDDYAHVVTWLIAKGGVAPESIAKTAAENPARFLGLQDRGEVAVGKVADLSILDLKAPETVRADELRTKCGWSPYEGREFPGRARWTIVGGRELLSDGELAA